jgi:malonyl-CoA/methylmalonyl-CoA synthetase
MSARSDSPPWAAHLPPGEHDAVLLADRSLPGRWTHHWRERAPWPQLQDVDGSWIASDELEQRTRRAAAALRAAGLQPGERFLLSGPTCAELVIAYLGALRAGLVVMPVNAAYTETEVARIVADGRPAAAVVESSELGRWVGAASEEEIPICGLDLGALPGGGSAEDDLDRAGSDDPALLIYTSGTTGRPKGALLTHGNLLSSATSVELAWRWEPEDTLLLALPLFHIHGLGVGLTGALCAGASVVLRAKFDAEDVVERCAGGGISLFFGVPAMYQRLCASGRAGELARLRLLVSGSAPLPAALAYEFAKQAGQLPLERYGMTETVMLTSNPYEGERKPGTVGFALPGVRVRLADDGEVQVSGPNVIEGYWERPEDNAEAFTDDGWFRTGDLGEFDEDGYLTLVGRSKELIITGGYNVHPREVEEALATHPGVREVAVVGRPSERWGEEVTAVVVASEPLEVDELREHAARQLAPYKVPKQIEFADELPRNAMGKLVRGKLR